MVVSFIFLYLHVKMVNVIIVCHFSHLAIVDVNLKCRNYS